MKYYKKIVFVRDHFIIEITDRFILFEAIVGYERSNVRIFVPKLNMYRKSWYQTNELCKWRYSNAIRYKCGLYLINLTHLNRTGYTLSGYSRTMPGRHRKSGSTNNDLIYIAHFLSIAIQRPDFLYFRNLYKMCKTTKQSMSTIKWRILVDKLIMFTFCSLSIILGEYKIQH